MIEKGLSFGRIHWKSDLFKTNIITCQLYRFCCAILLRNKVCISPLNFRCKIIHQQFQLHQRSFVLRQVLRIEAEHSMSDHPEKKLLILFAFFFPMPFIFLSSSGLAFTSDLIVPKYSINRPASAGPVDGMPCKKPSF